MGHFLVPRNKIRGRKSNNLKMKNKKGQMEWLFKILLWIVVIGILLGGLYFMFESLGVI